MRLLVILTNFDLSLFNEAITFLLSVPLYLFEFFLVSRLGAVSYDTSEYKVGYFHMY
jgi:hypothetical protein